MSEISETEIKSMTKEQNYMRGYKDCKSDVLDAISRIGLKKSDTKEVQAVAECLRAAEALPHVIHQPKMGRWEYVRYEGYCGNWHCSECRTIIPHMPEETDNTPIYKWCPMCGAKMQEESNG